jgi:hypothetical protein
MDILTRLRCLCIFGPFFLLFLPRIRGIYFLIYLYLKGAISLLMMFSLYNYSVSCIIVAW